MRYTEEVEDWMRWVLAERNDHALAIANRLLREAQLNDESRCLLTHLSRPVKVRFEGRQMEAYRFIYCVANRVALPFRVVIRHRCANRCCVNPAHLEEGDRRDNKHDEWAHAAYGVNPAMLPRG